VDSTIPGGQGQEGNPGAPTQKKLQHPVLFFAPEKMAVSRPALPHIPPQTHHKKTTSYTRFSQKTPAKTALHHSK
jgi:hypothetical protein